MSDKNQIVTTGLNVPELDAYIEKENAFQKETALTNSKNFAKRNQPHPTNDNLDHYILEFKSGYEKLIAHVKERLMPASQFMEAQMEAARDEEKDKKLAAQIQQAEGENHIDDIELKRYKGGNLFKIAKVVAILSLVILICETIFNIPAFQVLGENLLLSAIMAISISFIIGLFSHMVPMLYKEAKTRLWRILTIVISFIVALAAFTAMGNLRSSYLASAGVTSHPIYFVILNMLLFITACLLSFFFMPTWRELLEYWKHKIIQDRIHKREKEIQQCKAERQKLYDDTCERNSKRAKIVHACDYRKEKITKMFEETVHQFKSTNLIYRTDKKTPECFNDEIPSINTNDSIISKSHRLNKAS